MMVLWILLWLYVFQDYSTAIKLIEVRVPKHAVMNHSVSLECHYEMEGEALYSVKWYKDGNEFYRYVPRDDPPAQTFLVEGVLVNITNSTYNLVILESINLSSSGNYRCEVSAEAPSFQTVADNGEMLVVVLPEKDPIISGCKPRYQIGDYVRVNCSSSRSKPAAQLTWYINSDLVDLHYVHQYPTIISSTPDHLETSILGLEFRIKPKHFRRGDLKIKCLATILTIYWKSNEESVESDKPEKAPILESRRLGHLATTRADRVHAENGISLLKIPNPKLLIFTLIIYDFLISAMRTLNFR